MPNESQAHVTQQTAALSNRDIETMLESGISPEIVVAKIKASACDFDTGAAALRRLKERGATDAVLLAVIQAAAASSRTPPGPHAPRAAETAPVVLPAGTPVEMEAAHLVNSAQVRAGDAITFRVTKAVEVGGLTVIEAGAHATGRVVKARKGRHFGKAGELAWRAESVVAADGRKVALTFADRAVGHSKGGTVATAAVITGVLFWPAAPLWGFKKGKSAYIPAGKVFVPVVESDARVEAGRKN